MITAESSRQRYAYLALCGVACGVAFLTKGFIAWAIPAVVAAPYLVARRDWRTLLVSPWLPFGVAILVSLPWAVLVHLREPDFWRYFVVVEHLQRFAGDNAQHPQPPWFFLAYLPATGWPWVWLLPAAAIGIRGDDRNKDFLFYAALWAVMPLLLLGFEGQAAHLRVAVLRAVVDPARGGSRALLRVGPHARVPHRSGARCGAARALAGLLARRRRAYLARRHTGRTSM